MKQERVNLNMLFMNRIKQHNATNTKIIFDGIEGELLDCISCDNTQYISCVLPYITNRKIMKAFSELTGVRILTNNGIHLNSQIRKKQISVCELWDKNEKTVVKTLSRGRGRNRTLAHSKIIIGYCSDRKPIWVATGSWNATENAKNNIENMVISYESFFVDAYSTEFDVLWEKSRCKRFK